MKYITGTSFDQVLAILQETNVVSENIIKSLYNHVMSTREKVSLSKTIEEKEEMFFNQISTFANGLEVYSPVFSKEFRIWLISNFKKIKEEIYYRKAVCVILRREDKVLAVSRKNNSTLFGLVGGKVEINESIEDAIKREAREETGLNIYNLKLIDVREYKNYLEHCFTADWSGIITPQEQLDAIGETGVVKWLDEIDLANGFCGDYNAIMFEKLK